MGKTFNPGFQQLKEIADSIHIPLIMYLHADAKELMGNTMNKAKKL